MKKETGVKPKQTFATDFQEWHLDAFEEPKKWLDGIIRKGVAEAFCVMAEGHSYCRLVGADDGSPDDPTECQIEIFQPEVFDDGDLLWTFSIADTVARFIENYQDGQGPDGVLRGDDAKHALALRDALRKLANDLDAKIEAT